MKKIITVLIVLFTMALCGCSTNEMNQLENKYSQNEVKKFALEYVSEKYNEKPQITGIEAYKDICGGIDATSFVAFKGYVLKTDDYLIFMDFESDGTYQFSDTKQSVAIEQAMKQELVTIYDGKAYLSMSTNEVHTANDGNIVLPYLLELDHSYQQYFNGDLSTFFKEEQYHPVNIYMDKTENSDAITSIYNHFAQISTNVHVIEYESGIYDKLEPYFDQWEKINDYQDILYYVRRTSNWDAGVIEEVPVIKLVDGIYVKCECPVTLYDTIAEGFEYIYSKRPNGVEKDYAFDLTEKYIIASENMVRLKVIYVPDECNEDYRFYSIVKNGALKQEEELEDELLTQVGENQNKTYVIYGSGYLIVK